MCRARHVCSCCAFFSLGIHGFCKPPPSCLNDFAQYAHTILSLPSPPKVQPFPPHSAICSKHCAAFLCFTLRPVPYSLLFVWFILQYLLCAGFIVSRTAKGLERTFIKPLQVVQTCFTFQRPNTINIHFHAATKLLPLYSLSMLLCQCTPASYSPCVPCYHFAPLAG